MLSVGGPQEPTVAVGTPEPGAVLLALLASQEILLSSSVRSCKNHFPSCPAKL